MTEVIDKNKLVFWQEAEEEYGMAEPAILMEGYSDAIRLTQGNDTINLNYDSLNELIKHLKLLKINRK